MTFVVRETHPNKILNLTITANCNFFVEIDFRLKIYFFISLALYRLEISDNLLRYVFLNTIILLPPVQLIIFSQQFRDKYAATIKATKLLTSYNSKPPIPNFSPFSKKYNNLETVVELLAVVNVVICSSVSS